MPNLDSSPLKDLAPLGIFAGNGALPEMVARGALAQGRQVIVAGLRGEVDMARISALAKVSKEVPIGHLGAALRVFHEAGVQEAVMVGGVNKQHLFSRARPDRLAAKVLLRLRHFKDDAALRAVAQIFDEHGVAIVDASQFVAQDLAGEGLLSKRKLKDGERDDIDFGFDLLAELAPIDVGQTVVVRSGVILAVEAIEGTDACIRRGAALGQGQSVITRGGAVVCKRVKLGQDRRFDLPAVGPRTVATCAEAGIKVLAVEAGGTLLLDRQATIEAANKARISLVGGIPAQRQNLPRENDAAASTSPTRGDV